VGQAKGFGLRFQPYLEAEIIPPMDNVKYAAPNPAALQHESLKGLWWIVEYLPKRIKDPAANFAPRWIIHRGRPRFLTDGSDIHMSVFEREKLVSSYRPSNLPSRFNQIT